ncbi:hypothetical protein A3724_15930 [Alcanivorax sp. HI0033]|nr:hypothetical protein A3714_13940 [Alcanivorax sp. HI0007]KZX70769.1 hypothetical protein A3713_14680 [Alcanivorax sp. HI0003]KZX74057.1 hypothetical protein A3717_15290 [Alcanivorax sp. HI0013]KZX85153.1 hypothetical protein A3716_15645 [Alcanivorax sp. HI0011]KZY09878.1 hypothetical protein A3724_15930 [Alcanivorax sp. HI0033]KZY19958.1 hypothetical protein A3725_08060 [Alcanivorax sp. HI0035]
MNSTGPDDDKLTDIAITRKTGLSSNNAITATVISNILLDLLMPAFFRLTPPSTKMVFACKFMATL